MSTLIKFATFVWNITPSPSIREMYFSLFCRLARGHKRIVEIDGYRLELDLGQTIDVAVYLRRFERELVSAIERYTKAGDVVFDIGANSGVHAIAFAKQVVHGKVYAFEPMSFAYKKLTTNIALNPALNVAVENIALSNENNDSLDVSFRSSWRTDGVIDAHSDHVRCRKLDDWAVENKINRLNIVKIDVDGFEFPVLTGGKETIKRFKPLVFMEVGVYHFKDADKNPITWLDQLGYHFWSASSHAYLTPQSMQRLLESPAMSGVTINILASIDKSFLPVQ